MKLDRDDRIMPARSPRRAPMMQAAAEAPRYRRGEREALTLRRRRQIHRLRQVLRPVGLVAGVLAALAFWRSDAPQDVAEAMAAFFSDQAIKAGLVVTEIQVTGRERLSEAEFREALAVPLGTPIFSVELPELRERLAMIGWVKSVSVARRLPNRLEIHLEEREPAALWQNDGVMTLIDREGHPITSLDLGSYAYLPQVVGSGAQAAAAEFLPILESDPRLAGMVRALVRVGERRWDVVFENGVRARLPEKGERTAWQRLARLQQEHKLLAREIHIIDLRQPDRLVLRLTDQEIKRRQELLAPKTKGGQV